MAINYSGTKRNQGELEQVVFELYSNSGTFMNGIIDVQEGFKSGTDVYESKVTVAMTALNTGGVTAKNANEGERHHDQ